MGSANLLTKQQSKQSANLSQPSTKYHLETTPNPTTTHNHRSPRPLFTNMRHHLLSSSLTMAPSSSLSLSSKSSSTNPKKPLPNPNPNHHHHHLNSPSYSSSALLCKHSPSATLEILILILVLFSGTFLVTSYFLYIFQSLSLLLPPSLSLSSATSFVLSLLRDSTFLYYLSFFLFFVLTIIGFEVCCGYRSRKCGKIGCKGMKKATEFDLQIQSEDCFRSSEQKTDVRDIDELPWKGGSETNPDYECLRAELRKMAPPNGRAVLLFRAKCGCPVAKLQGWGPKRGGGRRNKK